MKILKGFLICCAFIPSLVLAGEYKVMIRGKLQSYSNEIVALKGPNGQMIRVPSSALPDKEGLVTGKATVVVYVSPKDLLLLNPDLVKKKK